MNWQDEHLHFQKQILIQVKILLIICVLFSFKDIILSGIYLKSFIKDGETSGLISAILWFTLTIFFLVMSKKFYVQYRKIKNKIGQQ